MKGLARHLLQTFEVGAMRHGATMISLGARETAKGFYDRMGYSGKSLDWHNEELILGLGHVIKGPSSLMTGLHLPNANCERSPLHRVPFLHLQRV